LKRIAQFLVLLMAVGIPASANMITNGGFEVPGLSSTYLTVNAGDTIIPGWIVTGTSVDLVLKSAYSAHDGVQSVDLAGTPGPGGLEQSFATVIGQQYYILFWLSSNGGPMSQSVQVKWDGSTVATFDSPAIGTWHPEIVTHTATSTTSTVEFFSPIQGNAGPLLDSVDVGAVPEPGTFTLCGLFLLAVGGCTRLRRK
jgi:choice-of-anchor C domain-containing protein